MKTLMKIELNEADEKYFAVVNFPGDAKDYVTGDCKTPTIALAQAVKMCDRHGKG